jgi:hypothetical protein
MDHTQFYLSAPEDYTMDDDILEQQPDSDWVRPL